MRLQVKESLVHEWKEKYANIYEINIGDEEKELDLNFIYREIGRQEYNQALINFQDDITKLQEHVCNLCVLHPKYDFSSGPAGVAESLSNNIIQTSNLMEGQAEVLLQHYREEMLHFDFQVDCIIHEAFPSLSIEEISNWPINKSMYYLSRAEYILKELKGVPLQFTQEEQNPAQQNYQYNFTNETDTSQSLSKEKGENGELSEAEVIAMLEENEAKNGRYINYNPNEELDIIPELSWFKAEEELKGDFE
ncbi:hypothetical protein [Virgibacillus salexigens]|uniref:Uncharacterized protein n=1 Tax=Virgibacillus massiliensis TaxID=1462526 RepID=A0A024QH18_9BACI|nr:hypothetical protein [Virgibacillus massiliensis]CDQ41809.1 hypothetical protein BN990_04186 [Virgibacillus massiliensis]